MQGNRQNLVPCRKMEGSPMRLFNRSTIRQRSVRFVEFNIIWLKQI
jgi:hypothetical protein